MRKSFRFSVVTEGSQVAPRGEVASLCTTSAHISNKQSNKYTGMNLEWIARKYVLGPWPGMGWSMARSVKETGRENLEGDGMKVGVRPQ